MNKIKIILAMPIYKRELLALNSIRSICDNTNINTSLDVTLLIGLNEANDYIKDFLKKYVPKSNIKIEVHDFKKNLGKGIAVNKLASFHEFNYIISIDSDMICIDSEWLNKMVYVFIQYNKHPIKNQYNQPRFLGSLCANQKGLDCHAISETDPKRIKIHLGSDFTIITHVYGIGVAGGVLMSNADTWNQIGGYNGSKLYATDDGHFNGDCNKLNKLVGYLQEVSFYHPFEFNDEYRKWKNNIIKESSKFIPYQTDQILK